MLGIMAYLYGRHHVLGSRHLFELLIFDLVLAAIVSILGIIAFWKIFEKADIPGWYSLIPLYHAWVLFEISGKPGWWSLTVLLALIPFVGWIPYFVLSIIAMLSLAKRFGKSKVFAVVGLVIFSIVGLLILALSDATYDADAESENHPSPEPPAKHRRTTKPTKR